MKTSSVIVRTLLTLVTVTLWRWAEAAIATVTPLISGPMAVEQLKDTKEGFVSAGLAAQIGGLNLPFILFLVILFLIWRKPVWEFVRSVRSVGGVAAIVVVVALLSVSSCQAYYADKDEVEYVTIKANQTAFLVPQVGDNKTSQSAFDSAAYLDAVKVAEKRIQIPHMLLPKRGVFNWNKYIPSAVLYMVTREPFVRMWTKEAARGTSTKNEGFFLETSESINIDFGVSIGAHIQIKDAALYLFNFGVSDKVAEGDNAEYPSVVYARPLAEVMDTVVHQRVQSLLAREYGKRTADQAITEKAQMMETVEKQVVEEYAKLGITIEYIGYASALNFDEQIQQAINKVYVAKMQALAAENEMKAMSARAALANIEVIQGLSKAVEKWDGKLPNLPSFVVVPSDMLGAFKSFLPSFGASTTGSIVPILSGGTTQPASTAPTPVEPEKK